MPSGTGTSATLLGPGLARAGGEWIISIERNQAAGPLEAALQSAKFNLQIVDDAQSLVWGKLVINTAINPLTALLRVANGELLTRPATRHVMGALARETAANHSSMFQDIRRGAPTEIDAICGAGKAAG